MPNGYGKNWIRLCAALEGFRARYGRWPSRIRIPELVAQELDELLTPAEYARILKKLAVISGDEGIMAEDDAGVSYDYIKEGFSKLKKDARAEAWLEVEPDMD